MVYQVKLYTDGQIVEFKDGIPIRRIATQGNIHQLIQSLKFSRSQHFTLICDETAPTDDIPQSRGGRHINDQGLKLLKAFEGCELEAYDDGVGVLTIGYGHTATVVPGMQITQAEADALLQHDLERFESYVEDLVQVDINPDQFSALVCFCYNTGPGEEGFGGSTLLRLLNEGDFAGASKQFLRWNKGGGEVMVGLTKRRLAEQALFNSQPWEFALNHDGNIDAIAETSTEATAASFTTPTATASLKLTDPPMQGDRVRQLQEALVNHGFALTPDGVFGQATDTALRQFQSQNGLTTDGIAGSQTLATLLA